MTCQPRDQAIVRREIVLSLSLFDLVPCSAVSSDGIGLAELLNLPRLFLLKVNVDAPMTLQKSSLASRARGDRAADKAEQRQLIVLNHDV